MTTLHIDFETRSAADLKKVGLHKYARDPSTDFWCLAFAFDDGPVCLCAPGDWSMEQQDRLMDHVRNGGIVVAHNAAFEFEIWNQIMVPRYGWPPLKIEQMRCTMAMAYAMALPGSLENAGAAVGLHNLKDAAGHRLMLQMAQPRARIDNPHHSIDNLTKPDCQPYVWWDDAERKEKLYAYCKKDVASERELESRIVPLSVHEERLWRIDHTINARGVRVDVPALNAAIAIVEAEKKRLDKKMREITGGVVATCNAHTQLADWITWQGVPIDGVAKADVIDALKLETLPDVVRTALLTRQEAAKSSTAKLKAMLAGAGEGDRLRGMFQYHGAGTGRWAGRRIQLHNLPRPKMKYDDIAAVMELLRTWTRSPEELAARIDVYYGSPLSVLSDCLRSFLIAAEGCDLIAGDYSNIEGRVIAWLAGEDWKLQAFRDFDAGTGPDIYKLAYSKSFGISIDEVDDRKRQIGKVEELALGFGGGVGAFQTMAKGYNVTVTDDLADEIKRGWRAAHPNIEAYWWALENAAMSAVRNPGWPRTVSGKYASVEYKVDGSFLWCTLPSGRKLCYPYPKIKERETPWGELKDQVHFMGVDSTSGKWSEQHTYGGSLSENITQAVARDLLAGAIVRLEDKGLPIALHCHDEIVVDMPAVPGLQEKIFSIMAHTPKWATGLPVTVSGGTRKRYGKF